MKVAFLHMVLSSVHGTSRLKSVRSYSGTKFWTRNA